MEGEAAGKRWQLEDVFFLKFKNRYVEVHCRGNLLLKIFHYKGAWDIYYWRAGLSLAVV